MQTDFEHLVRAIWAEVEARPDIIAGRKITMPDVVEQAELAQEARFSQNFPVLEHLQTALDLARQHDLAELANAFAGTAQVVSWSQNASYTEANCSRSFLDGYAYAGLSGPDDPLRWSVPRTGMLLMGPNVLYPGHNHAAREIYMLLTPGARWRLDGGDCFDVKAGELIFHDAWQMHEMQTRDLPMLAVVAWVEPGERTSIRWDESRMRATI